MKNITKYSFWPELEKLGFTPVRFNSQGKLNAIGAGLRDAQNREYITVEPMTFEWRVSSQFGAVIHVEFCETKEFTPRLWKQLRTTPGNTSFNFTTTTFNSAVHSFTVASTCRTKLKKRWRRRERS